MKPVIVLASASVRRSRILDECGIAHRVLASRVQEQVDVSRGPERVVLNNARLKAAEVAGRLKSGFVIGADTLVGFGKELFGKPACRREALRMLSVFSGRTISVYTGLWVIDVRQGRSAHAMSVSRIRVRRISPAESRQFIRVSGPFDKAGGFSIEGPGSFIFDDVRGSFYNILGLPMMKLYLIFKRLGVDLLQCCRTGLVVRQARQKLNRQGFKSS